MSYLVFARKYRPESFDEIIGQEHITITLSNAIKLNRIAHAYLFTGPRGTGKTSTARIFSKSLNCESGPTPEPCQKCTNCIEIKKGISPDVIEIDGASNRGIDQIRELKENVMFSPIKSRYKIFIIDEVHMLTREAFNALLKILEEPPSHVIFIFATTEPHKVPETIISRCQRFDFRRLTIPEISKQLKFIADNENLKITKEAIDKIANLSEGCLRDAEGFLDKASSFSENNITDEIIDRLSGIPDFNIYKSLIKAIYTNSQSEIIDIVHTIYNKGYNLNIFLQQLIKYYRVILLLKSQIKINEFSTDILNSLKEYTDYSEITLIAIINTLFEVLESLKYSHIPHIYIEMKLIYISKLDRFIDIDSYILENNLYDSQPTLHKSKIDKKVLNKPEKRSNVSSNYNKNWDGFLSYLDNNYPKLHPFLIGSKLVELTDREIKIQIVNGIHKDLLLKNFYNEFQKEINAFFKNDLKISVDILQKDNNKLTEEVDKNLEKLKNSFNAEIEDIRSNDV
ncbi:DNA polymerase III subunit gamma/tau [candidate division TA06 bacterium]|uniref:DNA polymerase III subunit gamma/tau n=1 Tax=candidate division TA06 bacterium TaxID=2250710 RepID=A0A660SBN1_UNCT6|nr:MAG: DNA polymerase III subunit gamma/tau [candidate division TA06 bacterium]